MGAFHHGQNAIRTALHRQVQEADQLRRVFVHRDDVVGELDRVAGGEANAIDAVDGGHQAQQFGERADIAVMRGAAVSVNVLAEQVDFAHALRRQLGDFEQHVVARAAHFLAAGVWHHAESAVFVAAFHDRHERGRAFGARLRQAIELFDLRETDIDHRAAGALNVVDHFRQAVQGLRAEYHVDARRAAADQFAFLRGHATADADDDRRVLLFQQAPAPQHGENFFLRFFTDRAGVQQQHVRFLGVVGPLEAVRAVQQVGHFR
ncbi:Uncharacterised protein [Acinetobacter baumannii]|nr:Uncharacterised protein [Acinetobacter baumannii]